MFLEFLFSGIWTLGGKKTDLCVMLFFFSLDIVARDAPIPVRFSFFPSSSTSFSSFHFRYDGDTSSVVSDDK